MCISTAADIECTVVEARLHAPGFYETLTRIYYVTRRGDVFLLRAPGAAVLLQPADDLPEDCTSVARSAMDEPRRQLASLIDRFATSLARA